MLPSPAIGQDVRYFCSVRLAFCDFPSCRNIQPPVQMGIGGRITHFPRHYLNNISVILPPCTHTMNVIVCYLSYLQFIIILYGKINTVGCSLSVCSVKGKSLTFWLDWILRCKWMDKLLVSQPVPAKTKKCRQVTCFCSISSLWYPKYF